MIAIPVVPGNKETSKEIRILNFLQGWIYNATSGHPSVDQLTSRIRSLER